MSDRKQLIRVIGTALLIALFVIGTKLGINPKLLLRLLFVAGGISAVYLFRNERTAGNYIGDRFRILQIVLK